MSIMSTITWFSLLHFLQHDVDKPELCPNTIYHMPCKYSHWHSVFVSELIKEEGSNVPNAFNYYVVTTD